mmetsp:Transcript_18687/g.35516  ORF Transcript_18687/g.35516 Transcript_18687/m.35516 type:complete len:97 (-) Transcript_18687:97-387(-)
MHTMAFLPQVINKRNILPSLSKKLLQALPRKWVAWSKFSQFTDVPAAAPLRRTAVTEQHLHTRPHSILFNRPHVPGKHGLALSLTRLPGACHFAFL